MSESPDDAPLSANRPTWQRALWVLGGVGFVAIGAVGIVVPGLPTTPLLLLAAACFARSSPRLYRWLLENKTFGPLIGDFRAGRGVSARVKKSAIATMSLFVGFALLVPLRGSLLPSLVVVAVALAGAGYILRLPTRRAEPEAEAIEDPSLVIRPSETTAARAAHPLDGPRGPR